MFGKVLQSALQNKTINSIVGKTGKAISTVGAAVNSQTGYLPKIQLAPGGLGAQLQSAAGYFAPKAYASELPKAVAGVKDQQIKVPTGISSAYGSGGGSYSSGGSGYVVPSSGGQPSGGGGDDGGYDYIGALRSAFSGARGALEGQAATFDSDLGNFKNLVQGGIDRAKSTFADQNAEDERIFGTDLKRLLQSDQELRQRRQGVFSGLNALDSSTYRDDVTKADQAVLEGQQSLDSEKRRAYKDRETQLNAYVQDATGKIESYSNEIARAKQGLQQAIASVNLDEAASIQNYIDNLMSQAQQLNAQREAMAMNLAQLQAQGTDVIGNLSRTNMGAFSNIFGQNLSNRIQSAISRYTPGNQGFVGSGYISSGGMTDEQKRQLGMLR